MCISVAVAAGRTGARVEEVFEWDVVRVSYERPSDGRAMMKTLPLEQVYTTLPYDVETAPLGVSDQTRSALMEDMQAQADAALPLTPVGGV